MNLNEEQLNVVSCKDKRILCLAGAGTGKTYTMLSKIVDLVQHEGVSCSSVLALTFTNAAAAEMELRYRKQVDSSYVPEFRTFHSFCYKLISSDLAVRTKIGYKDVPNIADDEYIRKLKMRIQQQFGLKYPNKSELSEKLKMQAKLWNEVYNRELVKDNLITFDKLCYDVCNLFKQDDPCTYRYKEQYRYIFVDEFQDTDTKQFDFVMSFEKSNVFVVGDAMQSLYSFRGADSSIIKRIAKSNDWTTLKLSKNYRSGYNICDFANSLTSNIEKEYRIFLRSDREGGLVSITDQNLSMFRTYQVPSKSLDFIGSFQKEGTTAVLCRTNAEVSTVCEFLKLNEIPFQTAKQDTTHLHLLKSYLDENYAVTWLASKLESDSYIKYIRNSWMSNYEYGKYTLNDFKNDFYSNYRVSGLIDSIIQLKDIIDNSENKIESICRNLDIPSEGLESFDDLIQKLSEESYEDNNSLYVGTIHSVKGLEYDNVILLNVDGPSFRLNKEDNLNVFYVGVTRAKNNLYIFMDRGKHGQAQ